MNEFLELCFAAGVFPLGYEIAKDFSVHFQHFLMNRKEKCKKLYDDFDKEKSNIPTEFLIEPKDSIVLPTLRTAILYVDDDEIRTLFSKLLASAFDSRKISHIHPCFVEIIKQLSPFDARILMNIHDNMDFHGIVATSKNREYSLVETSMLTDMKSIELIDMSISNLKRLGIIHIDSSTTPLYRGEEDECISMDFPEPLNQSSKICKILENNSLNGYTVNAYITNLGNDFLKTCID